MRGVKPPRPYPFPWLYLLFPKHAKKKLNYHLIISVFTCQIIFLTSCFGRDVKQQLLDRQKDVNDKCFKDIHSIQQWYTEGCSSHPRHDTTHTGTQMYRFEDGHCLHLQGYYYSSITLKEEGKISSEASYLNTSTHEDISLNTLASEFSSKFQHTCI